MKKIYRVYYTTPNNPEKKLAGTFTNEQTANDAHLQAVVDFPELVWELVEEDVSDLGLV